MNETAKIMVALAFSGDSEPNFNYAADLARKLSARLVVASVINSRDVEAVGRIVSMGYEVDGEHYIEEVKKERRTALERFVQNAGLPPQNVKVVFRVGHPADELLKIALEENVQMIVMGVKGRSNIEHMLVGSVAEKLFRRSPIPIVSYRDEVTAARLRQRLQGE